MVLAIAAATTSIPEGGSRLRARLHRKHLATVQLSILSPAWPAMAALGLLVLQAARCHRLLEGCSAAFHLQLARPPWLLVLLPLRLWSRGSLPTAGCCRGCPRGGGGCEYVTRESASFKRHRMRRNKSGSHGFSTINTIVKDMKGSQWHIRFTRNQQHNQLRNKKNQFRAESDNLRRIPAIHPTISE